ncbi:hypothetical protein JX265_009062 [Neoarthrinium moseri]|uniref:ATP-dependent RNA helicase DHX8 n=1 Tax=Neoarthrinium moseri TaxID=1658444 RepID=A0A9Q0AM34_9PEZI|nr:uncharacterized protein JN550_011447 [Neoarthrinium moseri]KAI1860599.1 hypothetical protein JN550_011447 [Neoarthrinium moseri]KAI1863016.1 hypothetical protein JX265_009062 [Neoarthrinium moseri]
MPLPKPGQQADETKEGSWAPTHQKQDKIPYRQIRASYDSETITVYQAYNEEIASQAVLHQKLNASPLFKPSRMTWIKPSWCWMMYRAGYSYKDRNQARILALKMRQCDFVRLLERAVLTTEWAALAADAGGSGGQLDGPAPAADTEGSAAKPRAAHVKVQWDPERSPNLGRLDHRSIQIGVPPGPLQADWVERWIVGIEDVTERARGLKAALDASPESSWQALLEQGLLLDEREFTVPEELRSVLGMD